MKLTKLKVVLFVAVNLVLSVGAARLMLDHSEAARLREEARVRAIHRNCANITEMVSAKRHEVFRNPDGYYVCVVSVPSRRFFDGEPHLLAVMVDKGDPDLQEQTQLIDDALSAKEHNKGD